ncbi:hypothetical protein [Georgenia sp. Marseille-Q6866]
MERSKLSEPAYTRLLGQTLRTELYPDLSAAVPDGLVATLPTLRSRLAYPLDEWRMNGRVHSDILTGDATDNIKALFELKSTTAYANMLGRSSYRTLVQADEGSPDLDPIAAKIISHYLDDTDPALDEIHHESDCITLTGLCPDRMRARLHPQGWHYPAVPQADVYRSTRGYLPAPERLRRDSIADLDYVFVAPNERSVEEFFLDTVCRPNEEWQVVYLADALPVWRSHRGHLGTAQEEVMLAELIDETDRFLV